MSEQDDFTIITDAQRPATRTWSTTTWLIVVAVVALLAFSAGMAVGTLSSRFGRAAQLPPPTVTNEGPTAIAQVQPTLPITDTEATPTPTLTATVTPTATVTLTPPPTVACTQPVDGEFAPFHDQAALGCATGPAAVMWAAWEPFERGAMFWRSDTNQAYAFFSTGEWSRVEQGWDGQDIPSRGEPPLGLLAPVRGFGYTWAIRDDLFQRLGWATAEEKGFCVLIQPFEQGDMLQSSAVEYCQDTLYNHAREPGWPRLLRVILDNGRWLPLAD